VMGGCLPGVSGMPVGGLPSNGMQTQGPSYASWYPRSGAATANRKRSAPDSQLSAAEYFSHGGMRGDLEYSLSPTSTPRPLDGDSTPRTGMTPRLLGDMTPRQGGLLSMGPGGGGGGFRGIDLGDGYPQHGMDSHEGSGFTPRPLADPTSTFVPRSLPELSSARKNFTPRAMPDLDGFTPRPLAEAHSGYTPRANADSGYTPRSNAEASDFGSSFARPGTGFNSRANDSIADFPSGFTPRPLPELDLTPRPSGDGIGFTPRPAPDDLSFSTGTPRPSDDNTPRIRQLLN